MPSDVSAHPTDAELSAFALGKAGDATLDHVARHLEVCPVCQERVAARTTDSFAGKFRQVQSQVGTDNPGGTDRGKTAGRSKVVVGGTVLGPNGLPDLGDGYEVQRELGRGGMGTVYLALNKLMNRLEVVKVMNAEIAAKPGVADRFLMEIQAAARLNHPNVVTAYTALQPHGGLALAMAYVDGLDLDKQVRQSGPLSLLRACNYTAQAARGLQHALDEGLIHRDIKPSNLMTTRVKNKTVLKVLDFGLAKFRGSLGTPGLTLTGQMMGTPSYIAPEQAMDASKADTRADVYSLGCTLYYLLAGKPPFGGSVMEVVLAHMQTPPPPLPDVPPALWAVIARMMAKKPADRYPTPGDVEKALLPFIKPGAALPEPAGALKKTTLLTPSSPEEEEFVLNSDLPQPAPPARREDWAAVTAGTTKSTSRTKTLAAAPAPVAVDVDVRVDLRMWLLRTRGGIPHWLIAVWATVVVGLMAFGIWWLGPGRGGAGGRTEVAGRDGNNTPVVPVNPNPNLNPTPPRPTRKGPDELPEQIDPNQKVTPPGGGTTPPKGSGNGSGGGGSVVVNPIDRMLPMPRAGTPLVVPAALIDLGTDWDDYCKAVLLPARSLPLLKQRVASRFAVWKEASDQGSPVGKILYARCLQEGLPAGTMKDPSAAQKAGFDLLHDAAISGDPVAEPVAMYLLGRCYEKGLGTKRNPDQMLLYYQRAADRNYPLAMTRLGVCYLRGMGVRPNMQLALKNLQNAAKAGDSDAMVEIGNAHHEGKFGVKDSATAAKRLEDAAALDNTTAMLNLGRLYANDLKNPDKAKWWYQKVVNHEHADADSKDEAREALIRLSKK